MQSPARKPCQFCGTPVLAQCAIVGCVPCQKFNRMKWAAEHAHLFTRK